MPYGMNHLSFLVLPNSVIHELAGLEMDYYWSVAADQKRLQSVEKELKSLIKQTSFWN